MTIISSEARNVITKTGIDSSISKVILTTSGIETGNYEISIVVMIKSEYITTIDPSQRHAPFITIATFDKPWCSHTLHHVLTQ